MKRNIRGNYALVVSIENLFFEAESLYEEVNRHRGTSFYVYILNFITNLILHIRGASILKNVTLNVYSTIGVVGVCQTDVMVVA